MGRTLKPLPPSTSKNQKIIEPTNNKIVLLLSLTAYICSTKTQNTMNNIRILLVEDEQSLAETIKLNLEFEGYKVSTANDGKKALKSLPIFNSLLYFM